MTKIRGLTEAAVLLTALYCARRYYRNWGATKAECQMWLPGDALVGDPVIRATEAVDIDASPSAVWPLILQRGQDGNPLDAAGQKNALPQDDEDGGPGRSEGGHFAVGDVVRLAPTGWMGLRNDLAMTIAEIVPEEFVVLQSVHSDMRWNALLSFHLQPHWEDRVRLLARVRIGLRYPGEVLAMELARPLIALGTKGLLLDTKRLAEHFVSTPMDEQCMASK